MADNRDFRIRIDLCFPPEQKAKADQLRDLIEPFLNSVVVINENKPEEERGFIDVELCGHRLQLPCNKIFRHEVGRERKIYDAIRTN